MISINRENNRTFRNSFFLFLTFIFIFLSCKKKGCTDPISLAYDNEARKDDGSCTYPENDKENYYLLFNWNMVSILWRYRERLLLMIFLPTTTMFKLLVCIKMMNSLQDISSLTQSYLDSVNGIVRLSSFLFRTK